jgi:hypothetical protein
MLMGGASYSRRANCSRKAALAEDLRKAIAEVMAIHESEMASIMAGDFDERPAFNLRLEAARRQKDSIVELYKEHVTSHGC